MKFKWYEVGYIILGAVCIFYYATKTSDYYGDIHGYVASVYKSQGFNKQEIYKKTYEDIAKTMNTFSAGYFLNLNISLENNLSNSKKVDGLWVELLFFKIRVLYIQCIKLIGNFNFTYTEASKMVSAFFAALFFIVYCLITKKINTSVFSSLLLFSIGLMTIAKTSSPDTLAYFFLLSIVMLFLSNHVLLSFILAALLPLARTDYAIFSVVFSVLNYSKYKNIALIPVLAVPLVFIINKSIGNLGYLHLFNYEFIYHWKVFPQDIMISTNFFDYLKPYFTFLKRFLYSINCIILYLYFLSLKTDGFDKKDSEDLILLCCVLTLICYFLLYPSNSLRHLFGFFSIILLISIAKTHNKIGSLNIVELYKNTFSK